MEKLSYYHKIKSIILIRIIMLLTAFTALNPAWGQTECGINQTNCPPPDLSAVCADTIVENVLGAFVTWTGPDFSLSCDTGGGPGYSFIMSFDLPESLSGRDCWLYSKVQRTGTGGGRLRLWQSVQSNSNPNPNFTTPAFFLPSSSTNSAMTITNGSGSNFLCNVYLVYPDGSLHLNTSFNVNGSNVYTFTVTPPHFGVYRFYYEFIGGGDNSDYVELLRINASLYGSACSGDINFYNISTNNPGDFFPVGTTPVTYTAIMRDASGAIILTDSCRFDVLVEGVTGQVLSTLDASCGRNNGSITLSAQSNASVHNFEYFIGSGPWKPFGAGNSQVIIPNLAPNTYSIRVRDLGLVRDCEMLDPISATIGMIPDTTHPYITANPSNLEFYGCNTDVITGLPYSETLKSISKAQFNAAGMYAADNCDSLSYSYIDSKNGLCPITVHRTFTVTDQGGNSASFVQTMIIIDNVAPVISNPVGSLDLTINCASDVPAIITSLIHAADNCGGLVTVTHFSDIVTPGSCPNKFSIRRTYRATDLCGNHSDFLQIITVDDHINPIIACASNINATTDLGVDYATVTVISPTFSDNCGVALISNNYTHSANASGHYPIGITNVVWTATDNCGNSSSCTQVITVTDNEKPKINCPADIISCTPVVPIIPPTATDNSGIASITGVRSDLLPISSNFPLGITTIVWTATDNYGNFSSCVQKVTVSLINVSASGSSQVSCHNASDGIITVTVNGGIAPYSFSINGDAPQSSNIFSGLAAGIYNVTASDANGCSANASAVTIHNPALLSASATGSSQVGCHNGSNGEINVSAHGGTGTYSYALNGGTPQASNIFSGLAAGTYNVVVRDANGCSATTNAVTIANPELLTASATGSSQVGCHNGADGVVTVTALGGTGAYSYSLNGATPQASNIFGGLTAGSYTVVVRDANGCSATTAAVIIANPTLLTASAVGSPQVNCHNGTDGVVTVTALGGTGAYSYSLNGATPQLSNIFSGLPAGSYTVVVRDANGCSATTEAILISNPAHLLVTVTGSSQVSCYGSEDGIITATAHGGTGTLSYILNGGTPQSSNIFGGLAAGSYSVVVRDANGCTASAEAVIIVNPTKLNASAEGSSQVSCYEASDGVITVTSSGGTGALSYSLNGGNPQASNIFSGLTAGSYTVVVRDANGCSITTNAVIIANPELLTASAKGSSQVSCNNAADGMITVAAHGGTGIYSYSLNGDTPQTSNVFDGLVAGSYTVVVRDINGCSAITEAIVIANPALLTAYAEGSPQTSCYGAEDGVIKVYASGGTGQYSYSLNGETPQASNIFSGLPAGKYFVTVRDVNGCSATTQVVIIPDPELLTASAEGSSQVSCYDATDGKLEVTANGGTGAYSYSLNGGTPQTSNIFGGLAAGSYKVVVRDINGCSATTEAIVIANPSLLAISIKNSLHVSCNGATDGTITVSVSGGTGAYNYSLNGADPQASNVFTDLAAGTFTVVVRDANGCSAISKPITIDNPDKLTATIEGTSQVSCNGSADGLINVTAHGGTGAYSYSLNDGIPQPIGTFSGLNSGIYFVVVRDANSCSYTTESVEIINPRPLTVEATASDPSCNNSSDGQIIVTAFGGTGHYLYALNDGEFQESNIFSHLSSGTYLVKAKDGNSCSTQIEKAIFNPGEITVTASGSSAVSCNGASDGSINVSAEGGTGHFTYSINGIDFQESNIFTDLGPGGYNITVLDANGCMGKISYSINSKDPIVVSILSNLNAECHGFSGGSAEIEATGGTSPYRYEWSNGSIGAAASSLQGGTYEITVSDANNCRMSKSITIGLNNFVEINPSNVFTPNEDGINDTWKVKNIELYPDNELVIINRWGNEVYSTKEYKNEWNGSQLNEGTYFFLLKANMCNEERKYSGYITIIK